MLRDRGEGGADHEEYRLEGGDVDPLLGILRELREHARVGLASMVQKMKKSWTSAKMKTRSPVEPLRVGRNHMRAETRDVGGRANG
jgi:hypothetical protein